MNEAEELRKAIALVLTGDEAGPVSFVNRAECTVQLPDALNTLQITIYLNRVILARSRILDRRVSDPDEPEPGITVILRGDKVVHFPGAAATKVGEVEVPAAPESHWSEFRVRLHTQDYPRIRSAWDYIYSHGCRGR